MAIGGGLAATLAVACPTLAASAEGTSPWSASGHARVRLIDAGLDAQAGGGVRLVGIQVELDPAYLTYWRSPGEAGLPPTVSFAASKDLKASTLLFPVPGRYSEDGIQAFGYKDGVVFPVLVTPADAAKPVSLAMNMDFAVCERLCLPAKAAASLTLDGDGTSPEAALVREALHRVPALARVGDPGPLAVIGADGTSADPDVTIRVRSQDAAVPTLFAEAPEPWFVQAGEGLWSADGTLTYRVKILARPPEPAPLPLRLTLAGTDGAIDVPVTLDAPPPKP